MLSHYIETWSSTGCTLCWSRICLSPWTKFLMAHGYNSLNESTLMLVQAQISKFAVFPYHQRMYNYTFHTDGHHKLVRWRFITLCAIDGYSRLIVFLKCSNNNRGSTVYGSFMQGVRQYGLPSRIRCDQGGENMLVSSQHMLCHRGSERRSVLVCSSAHNQWIEQLWRDMHRCVTGMFYKLFYFLEHQDLLDPINEIPYLCITLYLLSKNQPISAVI